MSKKLKTTKKKKFQVVTFVLIFQKQMGVMCWAFCKVCFDFSFLN